MMDFEYDVYEFGGKGFFEAIIEYLDYPRKQRERQLKNQEKIIELLRGATKEK